MVELLLSIVYPQKCVLCQEIIPYATGKVFCRECRPKITLINSGCPKCGKPLFCDDSDQIMNDGSGDQGAWVDSQVCNTCLGNVSFLRFNRAAMPYDDNISKVIYRFKYGMRQEYGELLGEIMADRYLDLFGETAIDYIMPVPLHKNRLKHRGFNQSQLLAAPLAKKIGVRLVNNGIFRAVDTEPQSSLGFKARANNVKDAFRNNKRIDISGKSILLVDDIFTTGSTLSACAKILLENGATNVYGYTLSIVCD